MQELKRQIVEIGKILYRREMIAGGEGNISVKIDRGRILTTPTGLCKGMLQPDDLTVVHLDGSVAPGQKRAPSSELPMHLEIYRARPDVFAVVHAHPIFATGFALAHIPLDRMLMPEIVMIFDRIPLVEYGTVGTSELSEKVGARIKDYDGLLLANHGAVTVGDDLWQAYFRMETLEHYAHIVWVANQLGGAKELSPENVKRLQK